MCLCVCLVIHSCLTLYNPMDYSLPGTSVRGDSPGKNTKMGCHVLLQGIFPTQGLNPGLPHCRQIPYCLSHQGSPKVILLLLLLLSRFSRVRLCATPQTRRQPTRLHHPWDSPGKYAGVGCHFLLQCMNVKS